MEKTYRRGQIYYADLNPVIGSEQGGIRPVLIVTRKPPVIQVVLKSLSYKKSNKKKKTSDIM